MDEIFTESWAELGRIQTPRITGDGTIFETIYKPMIRVPLWKGGEYLPEVLQDKANIVITNISGSYPRTAVWFPNTTGEVDYDILSKFDIVGFMPRWESENVIDTIKSLNPSQIQCTSINLTETTKAWYIDTPIMNQIPSEWFLTQVGTTLSQNVSISGTTIFVNELEKNGEQLFEIGDAITCGYESMLITAIDTLNSSLEVERGHYRSATGHSSGDRIAPHISFWTGTWVMNLSTLCPEISGQTWIDWAFGDYFDTVFPNLRDGIFLDRVEVSQSWLIPDSARTIDPDCSNTVLTNYSTFDTSWYNGVVGIITELKSRSSLVIGNTQGGYKTILNGCIFESYPGNWSENDETYQEWYNQIIISGGYVDVSKVNNPDSSILLTYELETPLSNVEDSPFFETNYVPNYQRMRYGLTSSLLGDGYFAYEINTVGQGSAGLLWFDEYDNVGLEKGYLGKPITDVSVLKDLEAYGKVYQREFEHGLVICNPTSISANITFDKRWKKINGGQDHSTNNGAEIASITIPARDGIVLLRIENTYIWQEPVISGAKWDCP